MLFRSRLLPFPALAGVSFTTSATWEAPESIRAQSLLHAPSTPALPTVFCLVCQLLQAMAIPSLLPGAVLSPSGQSPTWLQATSPRASMPRGFGQLSSLCSHRKEGRGDGSYVGHAAPWIFSASVTSPRQRVSAATRRTLQAADAPGSSNSIKG